MENTENKYMTVSEMAAYLKIGTSLAYQLVRKPDFPSMKVSKGKYISPKDKLDRWIDEQTERKA